MESGSAITIKTRVVQSYSGGFCLIQYYGLPRHTNKILVVLFVFPNTSKTDAHKGQTVAITETFTKNTKHSAAPAGDKHSGGGKHL